MLKTKKPRNKFETAVYRQLTKARVRFRYEGEKIPYIYSGHYIPDFILVNPTGLLYVELKGYLRPEHKRKMIAVKKCHPTYDIRFVFYKYNKSYIKWAEKNGFPWAIEKIPEVWYENS